MTLAVATLNGLLTVSCSPCFLLLQLSVVIFTMCFVYKEPGLVGSVKDLTQTQDIILATKMATTIGQMQEFQPDNENSLHT